MASGPTRQARRGIDLDSPQARRIVGLVAVLGIALGILIAIVRPSPFGESRTIYAEFDSVQGLGQIDRDVRIAGVNSGDIGEVTRIGDDAVVELNIDPDIDIHTDARASLRPHTLFEGSGYVDLHPGSPSAPLIEDEATIPIERTSVYVSLDEATRVLRKPIRESLADLAETASETVKGRAVEGLQRTLKAAPGLTRELGPTARALQGPEGDELGDAIIGLSQTVDSVAGQSDDLEEIPPNATATLESLLVDSGVPLDQAVEELPDILEGLAEGEEVTALVDRLDRLAVGLRPAARELTPALRELQPQLARSIPVSEDSLPLIRALGVILERTADAAPALTEVVDTLRPGARVLGDSVLPYLLKDSRLGLPSYLQLGSGFTSGNAALRPYQTEAQGPLGAGHVIRLGALLDSDFFTNLGLPSCDVVAALDPATAVALEAAGLCQP